MSVPDDPVSAYAIKQALSNLWPQKTQGAAQFLPNGCSRKMPLSFRSFEWGRLLEHSFLEHFCLDQFSVILGKCYMQDSRTPRLLEHFWVPILGASCSNKLFVGTVRPSQRQKTKNLNFLSLGGLGASREVGQKFKYRKSTEIPHLGSLPSGGQNLPDKNWTTI